MNTRAILKLLLIPVTTMVLALSCTDDKQSKIEGKVDGIDTLVQVTLLRQDFAKTELLETIKISPKKSTFRFKVGELTEPTFFQLRFEGRRNQFMVLLLEPAENAAVEVDLKRFSNYTVSGADESLKTQALTRRLAQTVKTLDSLNVLLGKATAPAERQSLNAEYEAAIDRQREFNTQFIWDNPMSRASVMALYQKVSDDRFVFESAEDVQLFKVVASSLIARYPDSDYAKGMLQDIKNQERVIRSHRLQELVQNVQSTLPEIALPNAKGDTVSLSSLRGKVILLDFWASFSQENLLENRELLELYRQYRGRGFEIFQVSLDVEREAWLAAIESAGLPWINVSELDPNGSVAAGMYNVTRLPANYIIDRNFEIAAKNLYGRDLERKIKELL
ncbi:MAG: TlpA disulfide reductase family protein [Tenuifilaceae bacterium]|jgi:peroxiredoxin|nr:TlpA disulfide reductase family protein [Tenuifilaceae bacterium]